MSEEKVNWTASQKQAFSYIERAVGEGLTATSALKEYRSGGGAIRDASWYSLYRETFNQIGWRERVEEIPNTYKIRSEMFQKTDMDFREEYVMQMKASGYSEEIGERITKWVTVESDKELTKQEWLWGAQQAVDSSLGSPIFVIDRLSDYTPLKRNPLD